MSFTIVIGSYLEPDEVARIASSYDDVVVHYRPDLLPVPRYACDHSAPARELSEEQRDEWRALVAAADAFFDFDWLEPALMRERCTKLQWIQATSAGIGALMQRTGLDQGSFVVTTAGGIHAVPLAEFVVMGALYFVKGMPQLNQWKHQRHWQRYTTRQLRGLRALVVGLGGMGREIVHQLSDHGVEVWGLGRTGASYQIDGIHQVIDRSGLDDALEHTDVLVLSSPLTPETENIIGAHQIARLKANAVVINVSRGQLIDQEALSDALRSGAIAGACLDVFREEPLPASSALWDLDNVIISPHSASTVSTENHDLVTLFLENLAHLREGTPLRNRYVAERGY